jgi:hypothetical protein
LEQKAQFKEAFDEIHLLYFSWLWNFNKRLDPISRLVLPPLSLATTVFSRLMSFHGSSLD